MKKILNGVARSLPGRMARVLCSAVMISIKRSHGRPLLAVQEFRKIIKIFRQHRFWPKDAQKWGVLDFKGDIAAQYISKSRLVSYQNYLNHPSFNPLVEDKAIFYNYCVQLGIPVPALYGIFFKQGSGWSNVGAGGVINNKEEFVRFIEEDCPTYFVIKPSQGVYGKGIRFVDKKEPDYSAAKLHDSLKKDEYSSFVIQEALVNHPDIMEINNKKGLQTLRISTFIDRSIDVSIVQAFFKAIVGNNLVDNLHSGTSGNLYCHIDVDSGRLSKPLLITEKGPITMSLHPDSGQRLEGIKLPLWDDAIALVQEAAIHFLPMRSIGWDVALSDRGPVLVEGNARWNPPNYSGDFGLSNKFFMEMVGKNNS